MFVPTIPFDNPGLAGHGVQVISNACFFCLRKSDSSFAGLLMATLNVPFDVKMPKRQRNFEAFEEILQELLLADLPLLACYQTLNNRLPTMLECFIPKWSASRPSRCPRWMKSQQDHLNWSSEQFLSTPPTASLIIHELKRMGAWKVPASFLWCGLKAACIRVSRLAKQGHASPAIYRKRAVHCVLCVLAYKKHHGNYWPWVQQSRSTFFNVFSSTHLSPKWLKYGLHHKVLVARRAFWPQLKKINSWNGLWVGLFPSAFREIWRLWNLSLSCKTFSWPRCKSKLSAFTRIRLGTSQSLLVTSGAKEQRPTTGGIFPKKLLLVNYSNFNKMLLVFSGQRIHLQIFPLYKQHVDVRLLSWVLTTWLLNAIANLPADPKLPGWMECFETKCRKARNNMKTSMQTFQIISNTPFVRLSSHQYAASKERFRWSFSVLRHDKERSPKFLPIVPTKHRVNRKHLSTAWFWNSCFHM